MLQADELAAERGADINAIAKDFDDADPVYTSDLVLGRVVRELHGRGAMARLVDFGWSFSTERLVRPDIVEVDKPSIAVALLRSTRARRRQLELSQVAVHALVAPIVLRLSRTRTNQTNAERHQPGGELRKPAARPRANEGRAVVALDRARSATLVESCSRTPRTSAPRAPGKSVAASTKRLWASRTVNGSHFCPLPARHQPLKSMVHKSAAPETSTRGRPSTLQMRTGGRRRFTLPSRRKMRTTVLRLGASAASLRWSTREILSGPQLGC